MQKPQDPSSHPFQIQFDALVTSQWIIPLQKPHAIIINASSTMHAQITSRKKLKIYLDLVVGSKAVLKTNRQRLHNHSEFCLNYKLGVQTERISAARGCALTVGRYKEADICTGYQDLTVSRIQCFILIIDSSLIILDGWSYFGTTTVSVNGKKENAKDTLPSNRFVLRYNRNDTIHLRFGDTNIDLILNPKPCVVCMDKSRTIRSRCGHLVLCHGCYNNIVSAPCKSLCPICRAPLQSKHLNDDDDMIISYRKPV
eukprot:612688_1